MPKGILKPYKLRYLYPATMTKPATIAHYSANDAEREIPLFLARGAHVELLVKTDRGLKVVGTYTVDTEHTVRSTDESNRLADVGGWECSCGRTGVKAPWEKTPGEDHAERFAPTVSEDES